MFGLLHFFCPCCDASIPMVPTAFMEQQRCPLCGSKGPPFEDLCSFNN